MANRVYNGPWRTIRLEVLERDGYSCQVRLPGCTRLATTVDHIVPWRLGGDWWNRENLRAACSHCNSSRTGETKRQRWTAARTFITLVVGSDETELLAHVNANAQPADVVVSKAALLRTIRDLGAATAAYNALISQLRNGQCQAARAWLTSSAKDADRALPHHRLVRLGPSPKYLGADPPGGPHASRSALPLALASTPSRSW